MKRAKMRVTDTFFRDFLPDGVTIIDVTYDPYLGEISLLLQSERFPESDRPFDVSPAIRQRSGFELVSFEVGGVDLVKESK